MLVELNVGVGERLEPELQRSVLRRRPVVVVERVRPDAVAVVAEDRVAHGDAAAGVRPRIAQPVALDERIVDERVAVAARPDVEAGVVEPGGVDMLEEPVDRVGGEQAVAADQAGVVGRQVLAVPAPRPDPARPGDAGAVAPAGRRPPRARGGGGVRHPGGRVPASQRQRGEARVPDATVSAQLRRWPAAHDEVRAETWDAVLEPEPVAVVPAALATTTRRRTAPVGTTPVAPAEPAPTGTMRVGLMLSTFDWPGGRRPSPIRWVGWSATPTGPEWSTCG